MSFFMAGKVLPEMAARRRCPGLGLNHQGNRAVVVNLNLHVGPELPRPHGYALASQRIHEFAIVRLGHLRWSRARITGTAALPGIAVERELRDDQNLPPISKRERFILPCSSSNIRRWMHLPATYCMLSGVSSRPTPRSISIPRPISAVSSPLMNTAERLTRCTSARTLVPGIPRS